MNTEELIADLRAEADLCRNETADDIAKLLDEAADEIERLRKIEREMNALAALRPLAPGWVE